MWQLETKIVKAAVLLVGDDAERKRLDFQSGTFLERKFLDKEVERVVFQTVKHDVCAYIGQVKMLGCEPGWGGDVVLVVSDVPVSDNERVDGQIQRLVSLDARESRTNWKLGVASAVAL